MASRGRVKKVERGATLVEFAIAGAIFFTAVFGLIEVTRMLWTNNALTDAARKGARYAALNKETDVTAVKNMVVYGVTNPSAGATPVIYGLTTDNVVVTYNNFGVKQGSVEVKITGYQFTFSVPLIGATLVMGDYHTVMPGESAGEEPPII
jgi:Flp pilus assembly protein TadG